MTESRGCLRTLRCALAALAISGCATGAPPVGKATARAATAQPSPPSAVASAVEELRAALGRGDTDAASKALDRARGPSLIGRDADRVAYYGATVHAYRGDYRGAASVLFEHILAVGQAARAAFDFHDAMIALRTADGDLTGALIECEEMVVAGASGTWTLDGMDRMTLVRLKQHWHRAYVLRMLAQTVTGDERRAFIRYAEQARQDYAALATPLRTLRDSIAVLDAYFAFCDGDRARMRAAALRVNTAEDDDVEDLYLVQLALDGAGDRDAAAALRNRILAAPPITVLTPIFVSWMRSDGAPDDQPRAFSPKFPAGVHPSR